MKSFWAWISDHLAALVALAAFVSSLFNRKKLKQLHLEINSRLTELIKASGAEKLAEGIKEGRQAGADERQSRVAESERVEDRVTAEKERVEDRAVPPVT
jgi:hypothetical protein